MQPLDRPAMLDEIRGEPIEQLGMRRRIAAQPEIARACRPAALPKWCIQTRLTMTRAVSGFSFDDDLPGQFQPAAAVPKGLSLRIDDLRNCRGTASPSRLGWPRSNIRGSYGRGESSKHHGPRRPFASTRLRAP